MRDAIELRTRTPQDRVSTFENLSREQVFDGRVMQRYASLIDEVVGRDEQVSDLGCSETNPEDKQSFH
ncbi:MAG: hypothetical protein GKR95_20940 [Gammaproteobacteria bacterium]|nr:hypothetical protein [Gammaproteobacteria bacterium]